MPNKSGRLNRQERTFVEVYARHERRHLRRGPRRLFQPAAERQSELEQARDHG